VTDFEKLLNDVVQGKGNLAPLRAWLDKALAKPGADHAALLATLDKAQADGLSEPVVRAIRTHIESVVPAATPKKAGAEFPFELEEMTPKSAEKTQIQAKSADKTVIGNDKTRPATDRTITATGDRTMIQQPTGDANATMRADQGQGRTVITRTAAPSEDATTRGGSSKTQITGGQETDPFAMESPPTGSRTGGSGPTTGTSWRTSTGLKASGGGDNLGAGSVLKDRFELMDVLGEGGMGKVYKARDLLKVEAKDKNPYIAVKTLTGDFKQHPESFIALQRESSKAQRLAHPNIATVYDFDRDGGTVYMTMEMMEGDELAKYIKHLPAGGLPVPEAMNIIRQLCDGLAYAHSKQLVHSDFKPGNAFLTKDGTVKLLDFGIARASKTRKDTVGETTVFDPGQLGALTPAYATVEMFEGLDPDPRDDIYALGAVAYELLTGKHPFNKLSAPKVLEKGLKPAPVAKLTGRQNKALFKALALRREDRTLTVEDFWDGMRPRKSRTKQIAAGVVAGIIILTAALYSPIVGYVHARRNSAVVAQIEANPANIPAELQKISSFDKDSQRTVLDTAKDNIIHYFEAQADADVNEAKGQFNYAGATKAIADANAYYPDSAELTKYGTTLGQNEKNLINQLNTNFNGYMSANKLMPTQNHQDITDVIRKLRAADPANIMLKDPRLAHSYAQMVQQSVNDKDFSGADDILKVGLDYAPSDAPLLNLQDQVKRELKREQDAQLVAQLEGKLRDALPGLKSLADFEKVREDMGKLHNLNPGDAVIQKMNDPLKSALSSALANAAQQKRWDDAEKSLYTYSHLLVVPDLLAQRQSLNQAEVAGGYVPSDMQARLTQIKQHRDSVDALLNGAKYDSDWDNQLMGGFQETTALLQPNDMEWYQELRDKVAKSYIKLSQTMIQQNRFDAAGNLLASGKLYSPQLPDFAPADQALATAVQAAQKAQAEKLRVAQIEGAKNTFQTQLAAASLDAAKQTYASLQQQLPASDTFFTETAPKAYAMEYLNLAKIKATSSDYRGALALIKTGLQYAPLDDLKKAQADYAGQASKGDLLIMVDSLQASGMGDLKSKLGDVQRQFPTDHNIADSLMKRLAQHIDSLKDTDAGLAYDLSNAAKSAFPESAAIQGLRIAPPARPSKFAALGRDAMKQNLLTKAQGYFDQGQQQEAGNQDLGQFGESLSKAKAAANQYFVAYQQYQQAGQTAQAQQYLQEAIHEWADNTQYIGENKKFATVQQPTHSANGSKPCTADLAGYGRSGRAECYDMLDGVHGPTLVVVPASGAIATPFAIGKYEVSVADINAYCKASGGCSALGGGDDMPATNVSFATAKAYVAWLSQKSGLRYFIPSQDQWVYAASTNGSDTNRDFNCNVKLGDSVIKGLSMLSTSTGKANAWGLVNYLGNAQEFVTAGGGVVAVGGDWQDPLADCTTSLARPTSGAADPLTGFRVARDINP
jgi:serine/threonine protein kinase